MKALVDNQVGGYRKAGRANGVLTEGGSLVLCTNGEDLRFTLHSIRLLIGCLSTEPFAAEPFSAEPFAANLTEPVSCLIENARCRASCSSQAFLE